jgi:cell division protein FtsA
LSARAPGGVTRPIAALDVGSSKVAALVGVAGLDGTVTPLGLGARACRGVKRGLVNDMAATEAAIRAAMDDAERQAGMQAGHVVVSLSAGGLASEVAEVELPVPEGRVTREHVARLLAEGRRSIDEGPGRTVLHAHPALYVIDGTNRVSDPVGFHAAKLGVGIHVVTASTPPIRNLDECVRAAHLGIQTIVASPVAAGMAVLETEERDIGVALIELGAGVTTIGCYASDQLLAIASVAMGGQDITDDIAATLATRRIHAEKLKNVHGSATLTPRDSHEFVDVPPIVEDGAAEPGRATAAQLNQIIRARLDQLFGRVNEALKTIGFTGQSGRQVVLTGGGAELAGIADFAQSALGRAVRVGKPRGLAQLSGDSNNAAWATVAGLAAFAAADPDNLWTLAEAQARRAQSGTPKSGLLRLVHNLRQGL